MLSRDSGIPMLDRGPRFGSAGQRAIRLNPTTSGHREVLMRQNVVRVVNGKVQLLLLPTSTPVHIFGADAVSAIVQGDTVVVQCKDGRTQIWRINPSGTSVSGPIRSIR